MSKDAKVVVHGGGANLYRISEHDGWFHAYHVDSSILAFTDRNIGKARTFQGALELIKSHSGKEVKEIR